jgi:hypothetical protein
MQHDFILICATGRSGSTTLQRIINTIPNTNICGENDNAILHILEFYRSTKCKNIVNKKYSEFLAKNIKPCWYNDFNKEQIKEQVKSLIISYLKNDNTATTLGFKEIRYNEKNIHLLKEFKELFPNTKIIIHLRRKVSEQIKSQWWAENKEESKKIITNINNALLTYYNNNKNYTYRSVFENLFDLEQVRQIFIFLGKEQYFDKVKIQNILNNNQN